MSIEKAKEFLIKVATDEEAGRKADSAYVDALTKVAAEEGFEVSQNDISKAMEDIGSFGQLSETELEQVAGGFGRFQHTFDSVVSFRSFLPSRSFATFLRYRS